ncbi:MAG: L-threonylcarbamoyladenylate synthase [Treponema sp.]|nr:L-threonylcarbamoyladenylate synthase [Treponema sp.]
MIEYIVPGNIDDRVLARAAKLLSEGGTVAMPTDTSWSVACSMNSREGIKRLKAISKERDERLFTLLCSDISQFGELCSLDNTRFRLIKRLSPGPYVFVLKTLLGTEKVLGLRRHEIGIRLPNYPVPLALIDALGCPLYGITAKRNMVAQRMDEDYSGDDELSEEDGHSPDESFYREETLFDGGWELEDIRGLDLILDPGEDRDRLFSTVLDLSSGEVQVLRQGAGPWPV